jgi:hypothetical protein
MAAVGTYAFVDKTEGVVTNLITAGEEIHPADIREDTHWVVDVTDLPTQPEIGWAYDGATFTEPVADVNRRSLNQKAANALKGNQTFQALQSPTNAQVLAQVQALTRQATALIRLVADQLDTTDGA